MGDCSLSHPKGNTAARQRLFEIVDNQRWLLGTIDVEFGNLSVHLDLELCPLSGDEVDIGLVVAGSFTAACDQSLPQLTRNGSQGSDRFRAGDDAPGTRRTRNITSTFSPYTPVNLDSG
jgi:hypothetical protein